MVPKRKYFLIVLTFVLGSNVVFSQSLTVNELQSLQFGSEIFPGISKKVDRTDANAAKFEISGEANGEVQIAFQLPTYLEDSNNNTLSISFSSTDAGYSTSELNQSSSTAFDPSTGVITSLSAEGYLYVWLGGEVTPLDTQPGNPYAGDIIMDVSYTN